MKPRYTDEQALLALRWILTIASFPVIALAYLYAALMWLAIAGFAIGSIVMIGLIAYQSLT